MRVVTMTEGSKGRAAVNLAQCGDLRRSMRSVTAISPSTLHVIFEGRDEAEAEIAWRCIMLYLQSDRRVLDLETVIGKAIEEHRARLAAEAEGGAK